MTRSLQATERLRHIASPLPRAPLSVVTHQLVLGEHLRPVARGDFRRPIRGVGVDDDDLVDQRYVGRNPSVQGVDLVDDLADRVGDVAAGQYRADREPELPLAMA